MPKFSIILLFFNILLPFFRTGPGRTKFYIILGYFCPFTFPHNNSEYQNFEKMKKASVHVYQNSWSYDVYFLRYEEQQTEIFIILGHFLHNNPEN